jgi:hypothetical protein
MSDNSTFIKKYRPYRLTDFYTNDKFKQAVNTLTFYLLGIITRVKHHY